MSEAFVCKLKSEKSAGASICRLCATLRKAECFVPIRDPNLNLTVKLERCCQLRLPATDRLPDVVCIDCLSSLNNSWAFAEKVHEAQESLRALYGGDDDDEEEEEKVEQDEEVKIVETNNERIEASLNTVANTSEELLESNQTLKDAELTEIPIEEFETHFVIHEIEDDETDDKDGDDASACEIDHSDLPPEEEQKYLQSLNEEEITELAENRSENADTNVDFIETWRDYSWTCTFCNATFSSVIDLRDHVTSNHNPKEVEYFCTDCSKLYTKYYLFLNHMRTHRSQLKVYCDICSEFLDSSTSLAKHRDQHQNSDRVAICPTCCKAFKTASAMAVHFQRHTIQMKFECDMCDKTFATKPNLRTHQKIHIGIKEYVCDQCGKGFVQKANLDEHLVTHVTVTPYECNECGSMFKTPARLVKHKTIHTDIRPHKCEECGREFREKDTLRVHSRIHSGVMPYECEFCGKRFRFRNILTTHRHQHTGVRPYSCLECNHHFTNWPNYNKHMKRRHGINTSGTTRRTKTGPASGLAVPIISSGLESASDLATSTTEISKLRRTENASGDGHAGSSSTIRNSISY